MVSFITLIRDGWNVYNEVLKDFKPSYNRCLEPQLFSDDYIDVDCMEVFNKTWNNKKYTPYNYYTDTLKHSPNYNLIEVKIYKNGYFKVINHGNKYKYYTPKY